MNIIERLKSVEISPLIAGIAIASLLLVFLVTIIWIKSSLSRVPVNSDNDTGGYTDGTSTMTTAVGNKATGKSSAKPGEEFADYTIISQRNLFMPAGTATNTADSLEPGKVSERTDTAALDLATLILPGLASSGTSPSRKAGTEGASGSDAGKNIAFTGVVESKGEKRALLENLSTLETKFVAQGEEAFGLQLTEIGERYALLEKEGTQVRLGLGDKKSDAISGAGQTAPANAADQSSTQDQSPGAGQSGSIYRPSTGDPVNSRRYENMRRRFMDRRRGGADGTGNASSESR
ncbi:MAG: hypothetical protein PHX89_02995 [bacterium]|jgi:hypothetical protein|nr:hypothetical protein [bacterium]